MYEVRYDWTSFIKDDWFIYHIEDNYCEKMENSLFIDTYEKIK